MTFPGSIGQMIEQAVNGTKSLEHKQLAAYLKKNEMKTVVGPIRYGKDGEWATGLILRFGGHAAAAGLSIRMADVEKFGEAFEQTVCELLTPAVLKNAMVALQAMGGQIFHMGPLGSAAVIKVITNMLAFIHLVADGEALMLAIPEREADGWPLEPTLASLHGKPFVMYSPYEARPFHQMLSERFERSLVAEAVELGLVVIQEYFRHRTCFP